MSYDYIMGTQGYPPLKHPDDVKDWKLEKIKIIFRYGPREFVCRNKGRRQPKCDKCTGRDDDCEYRLADYDRPIIRVLNLPRLNRKQLTYLRKILE